MQIGTGHRVLHLWSLSEDVVVEHRADGAMVVKGRWGAEWIDRPVPAVREALRRMELGPVLLANVETAAGKRGGGPGSPAGSGRTTGRRRGDGPDPGRVVMMRAVGRLSHLIVRTLGVDDLKGPLLSVSPMTRNASFAPAPLPEETPVRLPADTVLTPWRSGFTLERAEARHRVVLHRPEAVWVLGMLAWPVTPRAASAGLPLPREVTREVLSYLAAAGMLAPAGERERRRLHAG
ncbi:NADH oxidase [Streptomyces huiliensis]|uniref:NADH oxidase n=1 Tax=Streptomyces huiliensis TaxID=2876027 RepID=UPI001CBDB7DE|nr:NADH oxidase [Streptomyces huiliensis]MBZ4322866.1 NADH oxidase [Streptomyces huiliensis]